MARKKKQEEHVNHERWLVSYADFITLLFAFFVVMYSISSVNEGKYRVLSNSIVSAFNKDIKSLDPIQHGTNLSSPIIQHDVLKKRDKRHTKIGVDFEVVPTAEELAKMQKIADEININMQELIDQGLASVNKTNKGVEIEINAEILFFSGKAKLNRKAMDVLRRIAKILGNNESDINVEGFTDNVPIKTREFPSNWELSSARASSVVRLFTGAGIKAKRLVAVGYGEHKPVAPNFTKAGRKKNRRIAIMVLNRPRDDRVAIDDRTKAEKEADARRKLIKSLNGKTKIINLKKGKQTPGSAPVKLPLRSKPVVLGGAAKPVIALPKRSPVTTIGKQTGTTPVVKSSPQRAVIQLPKTLVSPVNERTGR